MPYAPSQEQIEAFKARMDTHRAKADEIVARIEAARDAKARMLVARELARFDRDLRKRRRLGDRNQTARVRGLYRQSDVQTRETHQ